MKKIATILFITFCVVTSFSQRVKFDVEKYNDSDTTISLEIKRSNTTVLLGLSLPSDVPTINGSYYLTMVNNNLYYINGDSDYKLQIDYDYKVITIYYGKKVITMKFRKVKKHKK